jgi:hypothetical protein
MSIISLLTVDDVMARLPGISERAIREELRRSGLAVKVRGKLYITADNFRTFIEGKQCRSS